MARGERATPPRAPTATPIGLYVAAPGDLAGDLAGAASAAPSAFVVAIVAWSCIGIPFWDTKLASIGIPIWDTNCPAPSERRKGDMSQTLLIHDQLRQMILS